MGGAARKGGVRCRSLPFFQGDRPMKVSARAIALNLLVVFATASASAQESRANLPPPPFDVAVSYSYMTEEYLDEDLPAGWVVSLQLHMNPRWTLVGEANGAYWGKEAFPAFFPYAAWVHSILGGPRVNLRIGEKTTLFGQGLAGWVRRTRTNPGSVIAPENEGNVDTLGVQPGAGVDIRLNRRFAVRFQGDYRWLKETEVTQRNTHEIRGLAGIVIGVERAP